MTSTHRQISDISIIIPTLNEEDNIGVLASHLAGAGCEIVVVDGGSTDNTVALALSAKFKVLQSIPGRAHQLNLGATEARGAILLFLHADTLLPKNFAPAVLRALENEGCTAGAFKLAIDDGSRAMRLIAWCANIRSKLLQLPYGDQAIFTSKEHFKTLGGFPDLAIMEDFVFIQNAKKLGRITTLHEHVTTSARRWQRKGVFRTTMINQVVVLGYFLGIPPERLALLYDR